MKVILIVIALVLGGLVSQKAQAQTNNAYGNNQAQVDVISGVPVYAIYSGDMNQDGYIDIFDFPAFDFDALSGASGYLVTDLNGDGYTDIFDFPVFDANSLAGVYVQRP